MLAVFKRDYAINFMGEDNIQSGQFIFTEGKGYQCEFKNHKLVIYDFDKVLSVKFNKKQIDKYLKETI